MAQDSITIFLPLMLTILCQLLLPTSSSFSQPYQPQNISGRDGSGKSEYSPSTAYDRPLINYNHQYPVQQDGDSGGSGVKNSRDAYTDPHYSTSGVSDSYGAPAYGKAYADKGHHEGSYHYQVYPSYSGYGYDQYDEKGVYSSLGGLAGLAGLLGLTGLKGVGIFGFLKTALLLSPLLLLLAPVALIILIILAIPLLLLPIPVITIPVPGAPVAGRRQLDNLATTARDFIAYKIFNDSQKCVERISCELAAQIPANATMQRAMKKKMEKFIRLAKEEILKRSINQTIENESTTRGEKFLARFSVGFQTGLSDNSVPYYSGSSPTTYHDKKRPKLSTSDSRCSVYQCSAIAYARKALRSTLQIFGK